MIKRILPSILFFALILLCFTNYAQTEQDSTDNKEKKDLLKGFSLSPQIGFYHYYGDLRSDDVISAFFDPEENKLGFGLYLNYSISDIFTLSAGIHQGSLRATNSLIEPNNASLYVPPASATANFNPGIEFRTDMLEMTFPRLDINLSRLIFRDRVDFFNKVSVNLFASQGLARFDSKVYALDDEDLNLIYFKDRGRTGETWAAVTSVGSSVSYIVNDRFDLAIESSLRGVNNDKLDAWPSPGSDNDMFSFTAVSFTYHLRSRSYVVKDFDLAENKVSEESIPQEDEDKEEELEEEVVEEVKEEVVESVKEVDTKVEEVKEEVVAETTEVEEKKETPQEEKKEKILAPANLELYTKPGNFVSVAAFRSFKVAQIEARKLQNKGESPIIVENRTGTWFIVAIEAFDDLEPALVRMRKAREEGYERSWVLVKPK